MTSSTVENVIQVELKKWETVNKLYQATTSKKKRSILQVDTTVWLSTAKFSHPVFRKIK